MTAKEPDLTKLVWRYKGSYGPFKNKFVFITSAVSTDDNGRDLYGRLVAYRYAIALMADIKTEFYANDDDLELVI